MQGQGEESKRWEQREAPTVCLGRPLSCAVKNEEGDREHTRRGEAGSQALLEASGRGTWVSDLVPALPQRLGVLYLPSSHRVPKRLLHVTYSLLALACPYKEHTSMQAHRNRRLYMCI